MAGRNTPAYNRAYYLKYIFKKKEYSTWFKRKNKIKAVEYKGGKCCHCGGIFDPCVYDFHHLDPSIKEHNIGGLLVKSWENIQKELDKCILLCSNCHRVLHYKLKDTQTECGNRRVRKDNTMVEVSENMIEEVKETTKTMGLEASYLEKLMEEMANPQPAPEHPQEKLERLKEENTERVVL